VSLNPFLWFSLVWNSDASNHSIVLQNASFM
jgi:hypothetical protein